MRTKSILAALVFVSALFCDAQVRRRALGPKTSIVDPNPMTTGIAHRWVWTSVPATPASNWVDLIQGDTMEASAGERPLVYSPYGIEFKDLGAPNIRHFTFSRTFPTNSWNISLTYPTNDAVCVVSTFYRADSSRSLLGGNSGVGNYGILGVYSNSAPPVWFTLSGTWGSQTYFVWVDYLYGLSRGPTNYMHYTNGVLGVTFTDNGIKLNTNDPVSVLFVGMDGTIGFSGVIPEIIHWTNIQAWNFGRSYFTSNQLYLVHNYMSNTYSPYINP